MNFNGDSYFGVGLPDSPEDCVYDLELFPLLPSGPSPKLRSEVQTFLRCSKPESGRIQTLPHIALIDAQGEGTEPFPYTRWWVSNQQQSVYAGGGEIHHVGKRRLVVAGPYRFSRNPNYLGYLIALVGLFLYRGELARADAWRARLDPTTNWAVVTTGGMLSFAFSDPVHSHVTLLLANLLTDLAYAVIDPRIRCIAKVSKRICRSGSKRSIASILSAAGGRPLDQSGSEFSDGFFGSLIVDQCLAVG